MSETNGEPKRQMAALIGLIAQSEAAWANERVVSQDEAFARAERAIQAYCTYPNDRNPSKS